MWLVLAILVGVPLLGSAAALSVTPANNDHPGAQTPCAAAESKAESVNTSATALPSPQGSAAVPSNGGGGESGFHHEIAPLDLPPDAPPLVKPAEPLPPQLGGVDIGMTDEGSEAKAQAERGEPAPTAKSPACRFAS
jgi:hypothetical protein